MSCFQKIFGSLLLTVILIPLAAFGQQNVVDVEDIQKAYKRIVEGDKLGPEVINGNDIYRVYHCSIEDPTPRYGEFTVTQFKDLQNKEYLFVNWDKCLMLSEYIQTSYMVENDQDETITIKSNASGFSAKTIEDNIDLGRAVGTTLIYTFDNLKKKYLAVELTHPDFDSEMAELEKKISGGYVFMRMSQNTIDRLAKQYYSDRSLNELEKLIREHPYSKSHFKTISLADSIRIERALSRGDELGFLLFIEDRPASPLMKIAQDWVGYFERAKSTYEKAKTVNDIASYESFLKNYDLSKFVDECKIKLVDAAASKFIQSSNPDSILFFYVNYLDKYKDTPGFKKNYYDMALTNMVNALDKKYLGDQSNNYNLAAITALWEHKHRLENGTGQKLTKLETRHKATICQGYFEQLTAAISIDSQNQVENSFRKLFYEFSTQSPIAFILDHAPNKNGNVTVYNLNYLVNDLDAKLGDKFSDQTTHLSVTHSLKTTQSIENLRWVENNYQGLQVVSNSKGKFYEINFTAFPIFDFEHFYKDGVIAKSSFYNDEGLVYTYEYQNGKNLTLGKLQEEINVGDAAFNEKRYEDALNIYKNLLGNPYPSNAPQNEYLTRAIKRTEEKMAAEERYRISKAKFSPAYRSADEIEIDGVMYNLMLIFPPIPNKVIMTYAYVYDTRAVDSPCEGTYTVNGKEQQLMVKFSRSNCADFSCFFELDEYTNEIRSITVNDYVLLPTQ